MSDQSVTVPNPQPVFVKFEDITPGTPLDQIKPMILQEIYDRALFGIRKQGEPSTFGAGAGALCLYKTSDGRKCAIGHSIPPQVYEEGMEHLPVSSVSAGSPTLRILWGLNSTRIGDLQTLQEIHDLLGMQGLTPEKYFEQFNSRMKKFAAERNLVYTPFETESAESAPV